MSTEQESIRKTTIQRTIHRPADEIADRPQLKVKPISHEDAVEAAAEAGSEATGQSATAQAATIIVEQPEADTAPGAAVEMPEAEEAATADAPRKVSRLPRIDPNRDPSLYATHRPAPPDETAERAQLAAATGRVAKGREISAGFLIGVALIVLALVGAVTIVRLEKHVRRLESRISALEQVQPQTAALSQPR